MSARRSVERAATACLAAHAALSLFSAVAFLTFLTGPAPAWLASPTSQRALAIGWRYGPATTVVLGALAGLLHATSRLGRGRAAALFAVGFTVALASELTGTATGYPFGPYAYTPVLGYRVAGLVPFNIPTSWFYMLYCASAITGRVTTGRSAWRWAAVAALVLTAWDVSMDPAMVRTGHWLWHLPPADDVLHRVFVSDAFYGMPLSNWLGWLLTGLVIARLWVAIVPPERWRRDVSPSTFPLVLYAVNGVLPLAICLAHGLWWALGLGALAMAAPLALAAWRRPNAAGRAATDELALAS